MAYISEIPATLDPDGELAVEVLTSMDEDVTVYVREGDLRKMMVAFGYQLVAMKGLGQ